MAAGSGQGLRCQLKGKTPSARARLKYILRQGDYARGREGPRDDLAGHGSGNLPAWAKGRPGRFWRAVDQFERANGRKCVELELNLPAELTLEQQHTALRAFARQVCGPEKLPYTYAIHAAPGNPHAHIMIQERGLDGIERTPQGHFKRASSVDPSFGGARKSRSISGAKWTFATRCVWAEALNAALVANGHEPRFNPHSKAVRAVEALRAGDLRAYGLLMTITEKHEGPKVHGMRRRWERGELEWEQIPEGAQATIRHNDHARTYNNRLRDWLRDATDEQLHERFGAELREQLELDNPSSHVAAWTAAQQGQALDDDRQRAVALATEAGELELLAATQIEAAERAALEAAELADAAAALVELDALVADEQADQLGALLSIERSQAHVAALIEGAERQRELAELVSGEVIDVTRQRLGIEREQAHSAALIDDAEHERLAFLDVMQKWGAHLGERPEVAQVHALADRLRAGDTGANGAAKELALSLRSAERARQAALEQEEKERQRRAELEVLRRQRVAGMQAEREQQRQAEQDRQVAPSPAPRSGLPAEPEAPETRALERRGGDEWVEFEEGGERYRHPAGRPDEIYWQNPSGEWHLQPGAGESEPDDYETGYDYR